MQILEKTHPQIRWMLWAFFLSTGASLNMATTALAGANCAWVGSGSSSGSTDFSLPVLVSENSYVRDSYGVPTSLWVKLEITHRKKHATLCVDTVKVRLRFFDCNNDQIGPVVVFDDFNLTVSPQIVYREHYFPILAGNIPATFEVDEYEGCMSSGCSSLFGWSDLNEYSAADGEEFLSSCPASPTDVPNFKSSLEKHTCAQVGQLIVPFYKTKRDGQYSLYTVPSCESSCPLRGSIYGETVNGEFVAPMDGILIVDVDGAAGPIVDFYGSASPGTPGWQEPPNMRSGQPLDDQQCMALAANQKYQFNVRAGIGEPTESFKVTFNWYWWDAVNCCVQHDRSVLEPEIREMPLLTVERALPQRALVTRSVGEDTELRLPSCGNERFPQGNLTDWFVMWPTDIGDDIQEGHAKGWSIQERVDPDGLKLILVAPGADGTETDFKN